MVKEPLMINRPDLNNTVVGIIGLGYVGLPLALAFSKHFETMGMDIDKEKVKALKAKYTGSALIFSDDPAVLKNADFILICVPTPVDDHKQPDLKAVKGAAAIAGRNLKLGCTVILESTVYPGVTEEVVKHVLEKESGLTCGKDFYIGYSPERINPGDDEHTVERVTKVVAGMNDEVTEIVASLYGKVVAKTYKATNIKTAEAAKVTENTQRDVNIALANELAMIYEKLGLNSKDVFDAAGTKWNFHRYNPGMVGGHCIPVVPYYLVYKAKEVGCKPLIIPAGRKVNDAMPAFIAELTAKALKKFRKITRTSSVLVMGLTYKENISEAKESPVKDLVKELKKHGMNVYGYEPFLDEVIIKNEFNAKPVKDLQTLKRQKVDAVIITVPHDAFLKISLDELKVIQNDSPVLIDIPGVFREKGAEKAGFCYRTL
jgi:UDP-N-acetyl-D-glucosamine/UDP-N-acetyl-D-galactosamine dehydrogenase